MKLSPQQLDKWMKLAGLPGLETDPLVKKFLDESINNAELLAEEEFYNAMLDRLTGTANPAAIAAARNAAKRQAETYVKGMGETEMRKIGEVIGENIKAGLNPREAAKKLDMVKGLDSQRAKTLANYEKKLKESGKKGKKLTDAVQRKHDSLLRDRRRTIAHHEQSIATAQGNYDRAKEDGAEWKRWMTSEDNRVADICRANQGSGWIKIEDNFASGQKMNPGHVRCRCTIAYRKAKPDKAAEARAQESIDNTDDAIKEAAPKKMKESVERVAEVVIANAINSPKLAKAKADLAEAEKKALEDT